MDVSFVDCKKGLQVSFARELTGYLREQYGEDGAEEGFVRPLLALDALRADLVNASHLASHYAALLHKYYVELEDLEQRVDLAGAGIKIPFAWYNSGAGDEKRVLVSSNELAFEKAAVLFNLAAHHVGAGGREGGDAEGLKRACSHYLAACGVLEAVGLLLDGRGGECGGGPGTGAAPAGVMLPQQCDLAGASLGFLQRWLLAGAQECFIRKGRLEGSIKAGMQARLSTGAAGLFEEARDAGEALLALGGGVASRAWVAGLGAAALHYRALAQHCKAAEALAAGRYGEEIARLREASELLTRVRDLRRHVRAGAPVLALVDALGGAVVRDLERALRDNAVIYHEAVPAPGALGAVAAAVVARATPFAALARPARPLLGALCPVRVYRRARQYCVLRNTAACALDARLQQLAAEVAGELGSGEGAGGAAGAEESAARGTLLSSAGMAAPAPLALGLPDAVVQASELVRSMGGAGGLQASVATIDALREEAEGAVTGVEELLAQEAAADAAARAEFGPGRWTRPASGALAAALHAGARAYRESLGAAAKSDALLRAQLEDALPGIETLGSARADLERMVPACTAASCESARADAGAAARAAEHVAALERAHGAVAACRARLALLLADDAVEDALPPALLPAEPEADAAFARWGEERARALLAPVDAEAAALDAGARPLLAALRQARAAYAASLDPSATLAARQAALDALAAAALAAQRISQHLDDAGRFYSGLLDMLARLRDNARDFAASRALELDELRAALLRDAPHHVPAPYGAPAPGPGAPYGLPPGPSAPHAWHPGLPVNYAPPAPFAPFYPPPAPGSGGPFYRPSPP